MAKPPGLRQRGKSWEIRVRVPKRLRAALKSEIVKSFGAISYADACRLAHLERAAIERRFADAELKLGLVTAPSLPIAARFSEPELLEVARRYLGEREANAPTIPLDSQAQDDMREAISDDAYFIGRSSALDDAGFHALAESFAFRQGYALPEGGERYKYLEAIQEALAEHHGRQLARLRGETVTTINAAFSGVGPAEEQAGSTTLAEAVEMYITAPERASNASSSKKMDRSRLGALRDIVGPAKPIGSITKADLRNYVGQLIKLPANFTKKFPGMSPGDAIAAGAKVNAPSLSPTSVERGVQAAKSLFGWLEKQDLIAKSPAQHLQAPKAPGKSPRRSFEPMEMRALLRATEAKKGKRDWTYWSVRIAMLQGLRFTEPLGFKVGDLVQLNGVWAFRVQPNAYRSLKTEETARDVPVHPRLIELGLLSLREGRDAGELLIADVPWSEKAKFNAAQKQMGRIVRRHVTSDPALTFHSLRHSFRDAMRDGSFPRSVEERLGGWKSGGSEAMDGYGRGHRVERLYQWIAAVKYDGVQIS